MHATLHNDFTDHGYIKPVIGDYIIGDYIISVLVAYSVNISYVATKLSYT